MKFLKNKRKIIALMCSVIFVFTIFASTGIISSAESTKTMNKFNVVLVTDTSGSMKSTDPNQYRFEAIDLFVGLIANGGNMVGSVVFGDGVVSKLDLTEVKSKLDKINITNDIKSQTESGWTDIGGALTAAVDMLKQKGKKELPSIIILLTDGNTEMSTAELTKKSIENKENAMEIARDEGYNIYTICLNKNKTANLAELKQIANATGGQFQEVTDAADLQNVFDLYYQMIYSTQSEKLVDERIPDSGILSRQFQVVDVGVEEVNIVIFGDVNKCVLTPPNGTAYTDAQIEDISYVAKTFRILKVVNPEPGVWNLDAHGKSGSTIKVFKIYNPNLQVKASIKNPQDSYVKGSPIDFTAQIYEGEQKVTDINRYTGYKATLEVKDYNGTVVKSVEATEATVDGFELSYTPEDYGTYYATISISNNEIYSNSEKFDLNVGNTPPVAKNEVLKKHINIWPFLIETDSTIDLTEAATDAEDSTLNYKIVSSTWLEDDYSLEGSNITINNFSVSKGSFKVEAYDSQGACCSFDVKVTSTNIGLLAMILMLIGGLIALAVILLVAHKNKLYAFMGSITAENLETGATGTPMKNRGQLKLLAFQIGNTGFDQKSYFQATGKNYVYFVAKKPFTSDSAYGKVKKLKIEASQDVMIYSDADQTRGMKVRFESMLNNGF